MESRWWAVAYAAPSGVLGTLDIQIETAQPFPVTPEFWGDMTDFVSRQKNGALLALTPITAPFGAVIGGKRVAVTLPTAVCLTSDA